MKRGYRLIINARSKFAHHPDVALEPDLCLADLSGDLQIA